MATKYASATGVWSTTTWWTTPAGTTVTTPPGVGDDADLNGKTVTVDQTVTCDNIVGSGTLGMSGSRTINANLGNATSSFGTTISGVGISVTINGNVTAGVTQNRISHNAHATNTLTINGNVTGGAGANIRAINQNLAATTINGNVTGGPGNGGAAIIVNSGTLTVTGNLSAHPTANAPAVSAVGGAVSVTGSLTDGAIAAVMTRQGATFSYTPGNNHTAIVGGKTLYPTSGGGIVSIFGGGLIR